MKPTVSHTVVFLLTLTLTILTPHASAADRGGERAKHRGPSPNFETMVLDVVVQRPVGIGAMVVGGALFVVSLPFSIPSHSVGSAFNEMVREPAAYTFRRCLGCDR